MIDMFDYGEAERIIEMAKQKIDSDLMMVFGSVIKGTANDDSDLDIILVKGSDENSLMIGAKARLSLKGSKIPIDITVYTPEEFKKDLSNKYSLAHEAMTTGRIICGSVW